LDKNQTHLDVTDAVLEIKKQEIAKLSYSKPPEPKNQS
jgi:hypothetical protein